MENVLKTAKRGFGKRSIATRWMMNTLSVVAILLIIANLCIYYFTKQYYYGSAESYVVSEANASQMVLLRLYEDLSVNFSSEVRHIIENFDKKDQMEMMSINRSGEVTLSSSGFSPAGTFDMPDYVSALESEDGLGIYFGRDGGENILAVSIMTTATSSTVSALRFVTSLTMVDEQISGIMLAALLISAFILLAVVMTGLYFVKSICVPLVQISATAKKVAKGDFSERLPVTSNDEIGQLSRAFNEMANGLENSEQIKNDFISSVSHELRTPLTAIKGWSETLNLGYDPETFSKGMKVITGETKRLERMVEELLDFSRIQSGHFTLQMSTIDVIAELEDALLIYIDKVKKESVALSYNEPEFLCAVYGDKNRLRQVFINIIDNALKYTEAGGSIDVLAEKNDDSVTVTVTDSGVGIAPEDLPKVKQKFYKANKTKHGSGIGLAVADEIISLHGGLLEVESELGYGTTVTITLPLVRKNERSEDE
ncbi:MAG: HAMP domain-containing histidine kinase [Lachnospiraceae bacterium]|nr:HAMP domain-containing histidine kinase [Ruminococcus sp.]MCM1275718.1 HAMP domain-containing histidine kinase [Lachnospiraceae bacterium]